MTVFTKDGTSKRVSVTNPATVKTLRDAGWVEEKTNDKAEAPKRSTRSKK